MPPLINGESEFWNKKIIIIIKKIRNEKKKKKEKEKKCDHFKACEVLASKPQILTICGERER
jgi:hypothetical protein